MNTNVARALLGTLGQLALDGRGAAALGVLNAVNTASGA